MMNTVDIITIIGVLALMGLGIYVLVSGVV